MTKSEVFLVWGEQEKLLRTKMIHENGTFANRKRLDERLFPNLDEVTRKRPAEDAERGRSLAFAIVCERHAQQLFCAAYRITRNREDAQDAVQDTFLRAFVHLKDFDGRSSLTTWLTRITINSALMILRKKRTAREIAIDGTHDFAIDGAAYQIADDAPNPEARYLRSEEHTILRTAIGSLGPSLQVVVQIQLLDHSARETAEATGISLTAAKGRLFHARRALRRLVLRKLGRLGDGRAGRSFRVNQLQGR